VTVTFTLGWWLAVPVVWTSVLLGVFTQEDYKEDLWLAYFGFWLVGMVLMLLARFLP
jgi:hypothetical protein